MEVFHRIEEGLSFFVRKNHTACLATNAHRMHNTDHPHPHHHRNGYPLDLFEKEISPQDNYSCFLEPVALHQQPHVCSHSHFYCPIKEEYIPITMTGFENASSQICHIFKALEDDSNSNNEQASFLPVNLILVGGSVTWGGYAGGCMEGTCSELKSNSFCATGVGGECAWVQSVLKYFHHKYKNPLPHFHLVDLAWGATSSCTLPHMLLQRLQSRNITITSRDLLLYDYSVNDGVAFTDAITLTRLRQCMESTFEKLVHYSTDGSPPTIVLLELYPFRNLSVAMQVPESMNSFTRIYHEIARKYRLPIISYRDLFWHPLFRADLKQYPKLEYIIEYKWSEPTNEDIHPPWVVHDIYADVITGALELTHLLCNNKNRTGASFIEDIPSDPWETFRSTRSAVGRVVINEEATIANAPFLTAEEISHLPYGWKLYQDRVGKPGWIVQGIVVEKPPPSNPRMLAFGTAYQDTNGSRQATLEVVYMQTYQNAGGFRVKVCNAFVPIFSPDEHQLHQQQQAAVVDTLIKEHYTSLEVAVFKVDLNQKSCVSKKGWLWVKFYHENLPDRLEKRGTQKVKITSVRLTVHGSPTK
jgi:hypothetical protein